MASDKPRDYELVVILSPDATEAEVDTSNEGTATFITERGGSVGETNNWGLRRLAYPIKKFQEGNYAVTRFTLNPQGALALGQSLETSEQVLRHLIVKV